MIKFIKQFVFFYLSMQILISCSAIGININRKTPANPAKYPEFTEADTLKGKITEGRKLFDVYYYEIDIDVDIAKKSIKGFVDIYFTAIDNLTRIQIDLYNNLIINKVIYESDSLCFERKYNAVFIKFNTEINKGSQNKIRVYYEGVPGIAARPPWEGGFVWKKDKSKNPWIGVACEVYGASLWWPVKDHLYDEPDSLKMIVTIPKGLFCVSNGRLVERRTISNKETFTWKTSYPINTYNVTLYIGDFSHFTLPYQKKDTTYNLDFYVLPYHSEIAKSHFKQTVDIIRFCENTFGEYPWWKDGFKLVESPYEGMEHQTAIAYGDLYKNRFGNNFDDIILHETAHEWWGNSISATDFAEVWLHEGFATYSEALYIENTEGYDKYLSYLNFYSLFIKNKQPVVGPYDVNYWKYKDTDVYLKGALILHTLRNIINNNPLFFDIIKTFYNENKYSVTTIKEFIDLVNIKTGNDYYWFFKQYLYSRVCPQLEWNYVRLPADNNFEYRYRWKNVDDDFKLPLTINANGENKIIYPTTKTQSVKLIIGQAMQQNINWSYISLKKNEDL